MKTENNYTNKSKFFSQYVYEDVLMVFEPELNDYRKAKLYPLDAHIWNGNSKNYLELKPLEKISDEEKLSFMQYFNFKHYKDLIEIDSSGKRLLIKQYDKILFEEKRHDSKYSDFQRMYADWFRDNGFACEWLKLSIDDLINYGWIKLL